MLRPVVLACSILLLGAGSPPVRPQRIVSQNLCADQLLLALADRSQIAALTQLARDPQMSAAAARARTVPATRGSAEDVLALHPDLLIATPGRRLQTMAWLQDRHIATLDLPPAESYAEIVRQVRQVAAAIGHPARGEALIRDMNARLARLPRSVGRSRVIAHYQRRGFVTGTGTLIDDLLGRVGLVNLARRLRLPSLSRLPLERLALARPDLLLVETESVQVRDQGTEQLHHPVIGRIPRVYLPQAWTVCGGPAFVLAAESLARQLDTGRS